MLAHTSLNSTSWLWWLLLLQPPSPPLTTDPPRLSLRVSTTQPFVGELVTVTLDIEIPAALEKHLPRRRAGEAAFFPRLQIPWLAADFGWTPGPEDWLRRQGKPMDAPVLKINDWPLPVWPEPISPTDAGPQTYRLTWHMVAREPDSFTRGQIRLQPVHLQYRQLDEQSNTVTLNTRKLPPPHGDLPRLFLGVGNLQMEAAFEPARVSLGSSARLILKVKGQGPVATLPRPSLLDLARYLPPDSFTVDDDGEEREPGHEVATFKYSAKPRRAGLLTVPPILFYCFEPQRGDYMTRSTGSTALNVLPPEPAKRNGAPPEASSLPDRLRPIPITSEGLAREKDLSSTVVAFMLLAPPILLLAWLVLRRLDLRGGWNHDQSGLSPVARDALAALDHPPRQPGIAADKMAGVFTGYLRERFLLHAREPLEADITQCLREHGQPAANIEAAVHLWEECEAVRFAGVASDAALAPLRARIAQVIRRLDRHE